MMFFIVEFMKDFLFFFVGYLDGFLMGFGFLVLKLDDDVLLDIFNLKIWGVLINDLVFSFCVLNYEIDVGVWLFNNYLLVKLE